MQINCLRRREFVTLLGGAAGWPLMARAQQPERLRGIGVLMQYAESDPEARERAKALAEGLQKLGWEVGRNLRIDYRWAGGDPDRFRLHAADLVKLEEALVLAVSTPAVNALRRESVTIPIVFTQVSDPISQGIVKSMAHPGGATTGFTNYDPAMGGKWLGLLKEAAPAVIQAAVVFNPKTAPYTALYMPSIEAAASSIAVKVTTVPVHDDAEIETAFAAFAREPAGGLIVMVDAFTSVHRGRIIEAAARLHLPAIYPFRYYTAEGGLMSYGIDQVEQIRGAATYIDRILKGERPGDLPVQTPTRFQLVINLKTAKTQGLKISESFLLRADELIE
jgi:putative tryptophan/tyrosine transport system substrate-binding protein